MAAAVVGDYTSRVTGAGDAVVEGRTFWKLTGSGNDFVFFDARTGNNAELLNANTIGAICDRRSGVGADGIVFFENPVEGGELYSIRYFNRDGSLAEMCGNAALCGVRVAQLLGVLRNGKAEPFFFHSSSGRLAGAIADDAADPEISMPMPLELTPNWEGARGSGEERIGFARVGVPHLVVVVQDLEAVDVAARGRELRNDPSLRDGANVNFVRRLAPGRWAMRTYERGVEAETLACGSGSVAAATLLAEWGIEPKHERILILARSGRDLAVSWKRVAGDLQPFLSGEGRLVFAGELRDLGSDTA